MGLVCASFKEKKKVSNVHEIYLNRRKCVLIFREKKFSISFFFFLNFVKLQF